MSKPMRIGVMLEEVQLSDISSIDLLGNLSLEYTQSSTLHGHFSAVAREMKFFYIATSLEPANMTPSIQYVPNATYDSAPRDLDILLIGGPSPSHRPAAADKFMREAVVHTKIIMTTCVGSLWLASSGALDGKKATTNREFLERAKTLYPQVEWLDQRWVVDGKFWTAGGAGAGYDMIGTYALENFDKEFVKTASLRAMDFDPTVVGQFYRESLEQWLR